MGHCCGVGLEKERERKKKEKRKKKERKKKENFDWGGGIGELTSFGERSKDRGASAASAVTGRREDTKWSVQSGTNAR